MLRQKLIGQVVASISRSGISTTSSANSAHGDSYWAIERINGREIVGFGGHQGLPSVNFLDTEEKGFQQYTDRYDAPYPSIRYRKDDDTIAAIRAKELGDWKNLSDEEKKLLYRYSFEKTYAELGARDGHWKIIVANTLIGLGVSLLFMWWLNRYVYKPLPHTFSEEWKEAGLQRQVDLMMDPIGGISAQYDYENQRWK